MPTTVHEDPLIEGVLQINWSSMAEQLFSLFYVKQLPSLLGLEAEHFEIG